MKVTKSYIKQLVKEELGKVLNEVFTPVEKYQGESEEDFKARRGMQRKADSEEMRKRSKLSDYKTSKAADYASQVVLEAAQALGFSTGDSSQGSLEPAQLNSGGEGVYFRVKMGQRTLAVIEEPLENERVVGVVVKSSIKGLPEKMKEIMGSNPRYSIRFA